MAEQPIPRLHPPQQPVPAASVAAQDEPPGQVEPGGVPTTGNRVIDAALAEFGRLEDHDPADQHDKLAALHEVLAGVLESTRGGAVQTPIPGLNQPHRR